MAVIIITIRKLSRLVERKMGHLPMTTWPVTTMLVLIFDEYHRSRFGAVHARIAGIFRRYRLPGFTGTPILADNAQERRQSAAMRRWAVFWRQASNLPRAVSRARPKAD